MNADQFNQLILNKESLVHIKAGDFDELTQKYPWFGTAQVLHAINLLKSKQPQAEEQTQKALMFVANSFWFEHQVSGFDQKEITPLVVEMPTTEIVEEPQEEVSNAEPIVEPVDTNINTTDQDSGKALNAESTMESVETTNTAFDHDNEMALNAEVIIESIDTINSGIDHNTDMALNAEASLSAIDTIHTNVDEETEAAINAEATVEATFVKEDSLKPLSEILKEPLKQTDNFEISFEPLHTIDYFASQGIKLKDDKSGNDKLGQQLKTFTEWLKSMKKLYVEEEPPIDIQTEKAVLHMAKSSNVEEAIITESMASVLEQQGKKGKAIEVYEKLSLLHPEKRVYFASLIEKLKS